MYPGIRVLLNEISGAGVHTAVCTNKIEEIAVDILERLDIARLFDAVVGHRGDRPMKPDPARSTRDGRARWRRPRARAHGRRHGRRQQCGDRRPNPAVLVSYGYSPVHVRALITDFHADSVEELRDVIMRFLAGADRPARRQAFRRV